MYSKVSKNQRCMWDVGYFRQWAGCPIANVLATRQRRTSILC